MNRQASVEVPQSMLCPITRMMFEDPVLAPDGYTYERTAIHIWLSQNSTSPMTRETMSPDSLVPNYALRDMIAEFKKANSLGGNGGGAPTMHLQQAKPAPREPPRVDIDSSTSVIAEARIAHLEMSVAQAQQDAAGQDQATRAPCVLLCILDVSESMAEPASLPEKGQEQTCYSRLDLVVHSIRSLISSLADFDRLGIVSFNDRAATVLPVIPMDSNGRCRALDSLKRLAASGQTNVWDALRLSLTLCPAGEHTSMLLLTDGQPSISPPRGTYETFAKMTKDRRDFTLHTFGYGYGLEQGLLPNLARAGRGSYGYIPDATMVGTVFINLLANLQTTAAHNLQVTLTSRGGVCRPLGFADVLKGHGGLTIDMGALGYTQSRSLCLELSYDAMVEARVTVDGVDAGMQTLTGVVTRSADSEALAAYARSLVVTEMSEALALALKGDFDGSAACVSSLASALAALNGGERVEQFIGDLTAPGTAEGQLGKAVEKAPWFAQWGQHYLPSAIRAHELEMCANFKDAAMQDYGGATFREAQAAAEALFCQLPAPTPSYGKAALAERTTDSTGRLYVRTMADYYDYSGGCFHGDAMVALANGMRSRIQDLKRGDVVRTRAGSVAVQCLVVTPCSKPVELVDLGASTVLTAYHPVLQHGSWRFPRTLATPAPAVVDAVYNVLLETGATDMLVGQHYCITLGHGITGNAIAAHDYLGTQRVVEDLRGMRGWDQGRVIIDGSKSERCPTTQRLVKWVQ